MMKTTNVCPYFGKPPVVRSPFSSVIYNVGLCRTVECCLCVGTRQALLQGWLLCVGFVCLANVPDLVRWLLLHHRTYFVLPLILKHNLKFKVMVRELVKQFFPCFLCTQLVAQSKNVLLIFCVFVF